MKRLGVFDLDGTLVDSRRSIELAMRDAWTTMGLEPPTYDQTRHIVGLSLLDAVKVLAPDLSEERYPELTEAYRNAFLKNREAGQEEFLYDGALETLQRLKAEGWLLGIATGKARRGIRHFFEHYDTAHFFDASFCAEDGPGKPDPHMLIRNMEALDVPPQRTIMIGDTSHDMEMARAAGCYALGVTWGFHTADEIEFAAHALVHDFSGLDAHLAGWSPAS